MATDREKTKLINDLFQSIFKVTQNDRIMSISDAETKALIGDGKWLIKIPGVCKIVITTDKQSGETEKSKSDDQEHIPLNDEDKGFNAPIHKKPIRPKVKGDKFINDIARDYE